MAGEVLSAIIVSGASLAGTILHHWDDRRKFTRIEVRLNGHGIDAPSDES